MLETVDCLEVGMVVPLGGCCGFGCKKAELWLSGSSWDGVVVWGDAVA